MQKKKFNFYTQYNQFYISSDGGNFLDDLHLDERAMGERLSTANNALIVVTESYGDIKGEISVLESPSSNINYHVFDHVVEGGLDVKSGQVEILDCPNVDSELTLKLQPGKYRVRVYSSNLKSVKERDLANDGDDDYYKIELWPSDEIGVKVLKQWNN